MAKWLEYYKVISPLSFYETKPTICNPLLPYKLGCVTTHAIGNVMLFGNHSNYLIKRMALNRAIYEKLIGTKFDK